MEYIGTIIRPPSEANSLILQCTLGCSHNKCTFCPAYKDKPFRVKNIERIKKDIDEASRYSDQIRRIFLCDGDVLILSQKKIVEILEYIKFRLPLASRIGIYANTRAILRKSPSELEQLKGYGLNTVYQGIESGDDETLERVKKGVTSEQQIEAGKAIMASGLKLSVTILLGIAGVNRSYIHAKETAKVLTQINPNYVGALTLMVVPGTPLYNDMKQGIFVLPDTFQLLEELAIMISESNLEKCLFFANHASNYLPIKAVLPQDKEKTLKAILKVIAERNSGSLKPEWMRGL